MTCVVYSFLSRDCLRLAKSVSACSQRRVDLQSAVMAWESHLGMLKF